MKLYSDLQKDMKSCICQCVHGRLTCMLMIISVSSTTVALEATKLDWPA